MASCTKYGWLEFRREQEVLYTANLKRESRCAAFLLAGRKLQE